MKLRWYTTYNKHGLDRETVLQYREDDEELWQDVDYVREREDDGEQEEDV